MGSGRARCRRIRLARPGARRVDAAAQARDNENAPIHGIPLRCLIVDNRLMVGELLGALLRTRLRAVHRLQGQDLATSCHEGIHLCQQRRPDLVILDLRLADGQGMAVARAAVQANPRCRILLLSAPRGAFICPPDLKPHVARVFDNATALHTLITALEEMLHQETGTGAGAPEPLTPRQQEVFRLIGCGLQNKRIARLLGLTLETVKTHRKEIARRLGVSGAELVRLAALQVQEWDGPSG